VGMGRMVMVLCDGWMVGIFRWSKGFCRVIN
jgi:hypothetical protein